MNRPSPSELADQIRTYGWWQGPDEALVALVEMADRYEHALERIATEKERVPVKKTTGVSGETRFRHGWPARFIAEVALGYTQQKQQTADVPSAHGNTAD